MADISLRRGRIGSALYDTSKFFADIKNKKEISVRSCILKDNFKFNRIIVPTDRKRTENVFYTLCPLFLNSIVDMPLVARLDIFAFGKFDMFSLCSNSI